MASILVSKQLPQDPEHDNADQAANGHTTPVGPRAVTENATKPTKSGQNKYRHVAAVHTRPRTSFLSSGYEGSVNFVGFRNLMVIVLSKSLLHSLKTLFFDDHLFYALSDC